MPAKTDLYDGIDLENNTHPHAIMGDFVKSYYELIKPALEKGDIKGVTGIIEDAYLNAQDARLGSLKLREGADVPYKLSLSILKAISDNRDELNKNKKASESILRNVNLQVSQLDIILQADEIYEKHRQREEE